MLLHSHFILRLVKHALLASLVFLLCCSTLVTAQDTIYYVSLNKAVRSGYYEGVHTWKEVRHHGDFGLGSTHRIAGELVVLNDTAYQFSADGSSQVMALNTSLAFAALTTFTPDKTYRLDKACTVDQLRHFLDSVLYKNSFAAIRITGDYSRISYFCYFPQEKPYVTIEQAVKKTFVRENVSGTWVGYHTPEAALVINAPEYHFHFIDARRNSGGHVEDGLIKQATVEIDYVHHLLIALPPPDALTETPLDHQRKP